MFDTIHGRKCVLVNGRWYAVQDREFGIADKIAMNTGSTGCVHDRVQRSARTNTKHVFNRR